MDQYSHTKPKDKHVDKSKEFMREQHKGKSLRHKDSTVDSQNFKYMAWRPGKMLVGSQEPSDLISSMDQNEPVEPLTIGTDSAVEPLDSIPPAINIVTPKTQSQIITDLYVLEPARYAEYFEWADGNPNKEDRIGYIVQLYKNKIEFALNPKRAIGVISSHSGVIATSQLGWYESDIKDKESIEGNKSETHVYLQRSKRKELNPVGILGKLYVRDNGKCIVGEYCDCVDGIAIPGKIWPILERNSHNIIRILYR